MPENQLARSRNLELKLYKALTVLRKQASGFGSLGQDDF